MEIARLIAGRAASDIITANTQMSVREAVSLLATKRIGAVPVLDGGRLAGIFSERDVLYRMSSDGPACLDVSVGDVMTAPPITVSVDTSSNQALALMTKRRIRHLPVVDGSGAMVGFISIGDIVKARIEEVENEAAQMRDYIQNA